MGVIGFHNFKWSIIILSTVPTMHGAPVARGLPFHFLVLSWLHTPPILPGGPWLPPSCSHHDLRLDAFALEDNGYGFREAAPKS